MKTLYIAAIVGFTLTSALGQGTILLDNNIPGVVVTHYYRANVLEVPPYGNGPHDFPPGIADYSRMLPLEGTGYFAQLYAAPGAGQTGGFLPAFPITTFRTGADAGFVVPVTATLQGLAADAQVATVQLFFWDNKGGTITDWEHAGAADAMRGRTESITVFNIGGQINPAPALVGLESASISYIPEPSAGWLLGTGLAAIAAWRRGFFPRP